MKRLFAIICSLALLSLSSCGSDEADEIVEISESSVAETEITDEPTTESETEHETESEPEPESALQECHKTIQNAEKPEVVRFSFEGECEGNIKAHAKVNDIFNSNVLHSGVVGLVGVPFALSFDEEVKPSKIAFTYDTGELRGIPEKNLIVLHYNENDDFYDTIESELDTEKGVVSAKITEDGVYMLADAYQWYSCWGVDVSEYEYEVDKSAYPTDWERENDTGDIMNLANKAWAMENAPVFNVSTPEELASVVWYVNGIDSNAIIILEDDIDLTGYEWKSIGWDKREFSGGVDGQNHTIKGLSIHEDYCDTGFIGYGLGVSVCNINFTDADVSATGCVGIVGGQLYMCGEWSNVHVSGKVEGGADDYACIVGRETNIKFKDCSANVIVNGEPFEYLSYRQKREAETEIVETFNITVADDFTIKRDEHDGFSNLCWVILRDGEQVLQRSAENETSYRHNNESGTYTVYLSAYINGTYIRVSNVVEYTVD